MLSNKQKTLTIVAFRQLGISEKDRHRIQAEFGGSESLRTMRYPGWRNLLKHLEARGFKSRSPLTANRSPQLTKDNGLRPGGAYAPEGQRTTDNPGRSGLIRKIYVLWYQLAGTYYTPGKEKAALRGFLRKRFRVDHENFLTTKKAIQVIEAVKSICARHNVMWD
jgi:hypothetical protein